MNRSDKKVIRAASSLARELIFLGIFAVLGLLALFTLAQHTEKVSGDETRAALIASSIMDALTINDNPRGVRIVSGINTNGTPICETLDPTTETNYTVAFDSSCEPLHQVNSREVPNPIPDRRVLALATLSLHPKPFIHGITTAELTVAIPASLPDEQRTLHHFVRLLAVP